MENTRSSCLSEKAVRASKNRVGDGEISKLTDGSGERGEVAVIRVYKRRIQERFSEKYLRENGRNFALMGLGAMLRSMQQVCALGF